MEWHNQNILFHQVKQDDHYQNNSNRMMINQFDIFELDLQQTKHFHWKHNEKSNYIEEFDEWMYHYLEYELKKSIRDEIWVNLEYNNQVEMIFIQNQIQFES